MRTLAEPNKIYIVGKVLMRAIKKCIFIEFEPLCQKLMDIYIKFTKITHQVWSCHVTLASNPQNLYLSPNSVLNFREKLPDLGEIGSRTKVKGKKQIGSGKHSSSAYRVKFFLKRNYHKIAHRN